MTPLEEEIRALIAAEGPIPVSRYMALCLAHPVHGYYLTRDPLGAKGDFTTAPEISQMFGELLGLWSAAVWQSMHAPQTVRLVELGPGRGTLMADALRAGRIVPGFTDAVDVHLVETSPVLRRKQEEALRPSGARVTWHARIEDVPAGPSIILANEFFDALPIAQFVRAANGWHERKVGIGPDGALAFGVDPISSPMASAFARHIPPPYKPGAVLEHLESGAMEALAGRLAAGEGAALIIDYGHMRSGLGDTLQALSAHRFADPLAQPGEADLTAHVDFAALARSATRAGARAFGPLTQGDFLERLGLSARADRLKFNATVDQKEAVDVAHRRLAGTADGEMGTLFKVLCLTSTAFVSPPGFDPSEAFSESP
ncbi:SAM-dependent methyltransferase [Aquabacter sp. L1I39]|uniref:class I SAM-dependent methyltransferase n=1 Tax=Aquabacter sp. L1I39 TaxID=2820278 RepID=UPI001AD9CA35|nr:SAM-dependent methyltransferase [Aquabacter sp. L1I39]QTL05829.1 SAM-dependent methyltransferase [Aquabacter sp. L1I39]